jgi:uncharacterized protein YcbK (DUF882 family)
MLHFKEEEFACKCCGQVKMDDTFLIMVDSARAIADIPFKITSGYRCPKHNAEVGSTSTNHTSGKAADIKCTYGPDRLKMITALIAVGFKRIGIGKDFIHCDINEGARSIWLY